MKHKYIDYFFAVFEIVIVLSCIFKWFSDNTDFYRVMLGLAALELAMRRFFDGLERDKDE